MDNPHGVIRATPEYDEAIFKVLCRLHEENGMWPMNEEKVRLTIYNATHGSPTQPMIIGLILGEDKSIEGLVWLVLTDSWYTDFYCWMEKLLYVTPEHRRSTHAKRLVEFAKWCSDTTSERLKDGDGPQKEIPLVIGIMTYKSLLPKMRLYQRQFKQTGAMFMHRMVPDDAFNQKRIEG